MKNTREKKIIFFSILVAVMFYGIYQFFRRKDIQENGPFLKGTVVSSEGDKGGIMITVEYKYFGKVYKGRVNSELGKAAIGNQYFIQVSPTNPNSLVFHRDKLVPDCLTNVEAPDKGWDKIPSCP